MKSREIIKILEKNGWIEVSSNGSHRKYRNPETKKTTIVPYHVKDLPNNTVRAIEKQTGLKLLK